MRNLAMPQNPSEETISFVSETCRTELETAGIETFEGGVSIHGEVPSRIHGQLGQWAFKRAWTYWIADGPGIPPEIAEELHAKQAGKPRHSPLPQAAELQEVE